MELNRRGKSEHKKAQADACCPCRAFRCVCVHHVSTPLWLLTTCTSSIIHSFALTESTRTYHRSARGRERWKGHNVQLDQWGGCTAKRANVHRGRVCVCAGVCVCVLSLPGCACCREPGVLMCDSQYSAVVPVEHILLNHWCWHTHTRTATRMLPLLYSMGWKMSRGISFLLLPVYSDSGKPVVARTLADSLMWHWRAVLVRCIKLFRTR